MNDPATTFTWVLIVVGFVFAIAYLWTEFLEELDDWLARRAAARYLETLEDEIEAMWRQYDGPMDDLRTELYLYDKRREIAEEGDEWALVPYARKLREALQ